MNWAEALMSAGIIVLAALAGGSTDPIKRIHKVPMCRVECVVFNGEVKCSGKTEDVWSDFLAREIAKSEHNYCGACGSLKECPKQ